MKLTVSMLDSIAAALDSAIFKNGLDRSNLLSAKAWVSEEFERRAISENKGENRFLASMNAERRKWLNTLVEDGPQCRGLRKAAIDCLALGWTEWDIRLPDGSPISEMEARKRFGDEWPRSVRISSCERITQAGRDALLKGASQ